MPSKTINMHGKLYTLLDEKIRIESIAKADAQKIRDNGQVAFLNPQKRKDKPTNYWIYVAEKTIRRSSRKSVSSKLLLTEYKKGSESFEKFMKALEEAQTISNKVEEAYINELAKETPKKVVPTKTNGKKAPTKAKNGKKANGKKAPSKK